MKCAKIIDIAFQIVHLKQKNFAALYDHDCVKFTEKLIIMTPAGVSSHNFI